MRPRINNMQLCVKLARGAYKNLRDRDVRQAAEITWFNNVEGDVEERGRTAFFVGNIGIRRRIAVVFRGSKYAEEWWDNFANIDPMSASNFDYGNPGDIHSGFGSTILSVWPQLSAMLDRKVRAYPGKQIWFTGHSRGGALAILAAMLAKAHKYPVRWVCTFGAPRVGDTTFASSYDYKVKHYRVEHGDDLVSVSFPPPPLFKHTGKLRYIPPGGGRIAERRPRDPKIPGNLDHHGIDTYTRALHNSSS